MTLDPLLQELRDAPQPVLRLRTELTGPEPREVALLSGSFDPITVAHEALAEAALVHANLVLLVYSVRTLSKDVDSPPPLLSEDERLAALEAYCQARQGMEPALCSHGLLAEQAEAAAARFPASQIALVMGSDKVRQLLDAQWYQDRDRTLSTLFQRARILYAVRAGDAGAIEALVGQPPNDVWKERFTPLDVSPEVAAISSRAVREQFASGADVSASVPPEAAVILERRRPRS
jgi:nicotinic acid mononucleotide adenylyltransferase